MSIKKAISRGLADALGAGVAAIVSRKQAKALAEMPETPLLALPEDKPCTATAGWADANDRSESL